MDPFDDIQCEDFFTPEMDNNNCDIEPPEDDFLEAQYEDRFADFGTEDATCLGDE